MSDMGIFILGAIISATLLVLLGIQTRQVTRILLMSEQKEPSTTDNYEIVSNEKSWPELPEEMKAKTRNTI